MISNKKGCVARIKAAVEERMVERTVERVLYSMPVIAIFRRIRPFSRSHTLDPIAATYHNLGNARQTISHCSCRVLILVSSHAECYTHTESRAGVTGLTTALVLRQNGYENITITAKHMPGDRDTEYTSPWAAVNYVPSAPHSISYICVYSLQF
jgi:hypothetical protein